MSIKFTCGGKHVYVSIDCARLSKVIDSMFSLSESVPLEGGCFPVALPLKTTSRAVLDSVNLYLEWHYLNNHDKFGAYVTPDPTGLSDVSFWSDPEVDAWCKRFPLVLSVVELHDLGVIADFLDIPSLLDLVTYSFAKEHMKPLLSTFPCNKEKLRVVCAQFQNGRDAVVDGIEVRDDEDEDLEYERKFGWVEGEF